MRGFVSVVLLCAFVVAQWAANTTPAAAHIAVAAISATNDAGEQSVILTEPQDTCCYYTLMKRMKRNGSCKTDCTYLPAQSDIRFSKPVAVYAMSEPHPSATPGNHKLLRPPIL